MAHRASVVIAQTSGVSQFEGGGVNYLVQTPAGVLYQVYVDSTTDAAFKKSTDGGKTCSNQTEIFAGTVSALSIWYDRWSNINAGLIHIAYQETGTDDTLYRTINTESSDALSTQTVIFAGGTTLAGGQLTIARARGGNVYCRTCIDAGTEGGFFRLPNANVPNGAWDAARTINEALATTDQMILVPGWAADNQDMMAFFWDASAEEISRQLYDDSANSWGETSIATGMTDQVATAAFPHFASAVDIANSRNLLVAWSAVDTLNADLRCWHVTESAITEVTNVVLNSTDDQGLCGICIDLQTGYWIVVYGGSSGGGETFQTAINLYYKVSKDSGTTWGPETVLTLEAVDTTWLCTVPRLNVGPLPVAFHVSSSFFELQCNVEISNPRTSYHLVGG